ncbi:MAG: ATP-binding protein [bacterium]|nr:ATP-binding protein [bacterium]
MTGLDPQKLVEAMGQAVLIFDSAGRLIGYNQLARGLIGPDFKLIKNEGWKAAVLLMNTRITDPRRNAETVRDEAFHAGRPQRFQLYRLGEYLPCWISVIQADNGDWHTLVMVEQPDWTIVSDLLTFYLSEVVNGVDATQGHAQLIARSLALQKPGESVEKLTHRIGGFTRLIDIHMHRIGYLTTMMRRLETIRTGHVKDQIGQALRKIDLLEFVGNFVEEMDDEQWIDPESDLTNESQRARLNISISPDLAIHAAPAYLTRVLRDVLRNAIMYTMKATPIQVRAHANPRDYTVQIDVEDEGYGIRASEHERVFQPFARSRQPQVMGEFGYGLSLFLCKHEIEAMNGRMWFESEENVGTTVSIKLPMWRDSNTPRSSSS